MMKTKRKRINLSIKPDFQLRILCRIFMIILIAVMLSGLIFWIGSSRKTKATYYQFHVQLRDFRDLILPLAIIGTIAGSLAAILISLFCPLYLAGPLYRIEKAIKRAADGDLTDSRLHIRPRDEYKDLATHISTMIGTIRERLLALREGNRHIETCLHQISVALEGSNVDEIRQTIQAADEEIAKTREILDEFKL